MHRHPMKIFIWKDGFIFINLKQIQNSNVQSRNLSLFGLFLFQKFAPVSH